MQQRAFGKAGFTTSVIGLGTWPIGGARYGPSDDETAIRTIRTALELGVTCFDTAPSYANGHAEELLGLALQGHRSEVKIVTKGGLIWDKGSRIIGRDSSRRNLEAQIDASLRRLKTDYVDLYLIHWPDPNTPFDETMAVLEDFVRVGKARHIGVSNFNSAQLRSSIAALCEFPLAANQVSFSLFDRRWQRETFSTCRELGIAVMAYGPLAHGLLTDTFTGSTVFDPSDWRSSGVLFGQALLIPGNLERNLEVVAKLREIARRLGITLPQLAIAWVLAHQPVATALVGARTPAEISEATKAAGIQLNQEVLSEIEEVMQGAAGLSTELPV